MGAFQLIDGDKRFAEGAKEFLESCGPGAGLDYHLVSVFGSQSSGKSTLLNALFNTEFGVMDEAARKQTTHGIWMGHNTWNNNNNNNNNSQQNQSHIFVLDVEGTDGRERGEDQDFERKAALFALASSEVLIVNMWEHQVGLYRGANMTLLKTVFEVNLSMFQASASHKLPRSKILFVIRDFIGTTPLENLKNTIFSDLSTSWSEISKPTKELEQSEIGDFFDIDFVALPHKVLQPQLFIQAVDELRERFHTINEEKQLFDVRYHRQVPLDGWSFYAQQIWNQIEENKDLDLPTQQILLSQFRCLEIANAAWIELTQAISDTGLELGASKPVPEFGAHLRPLREAAFAAYDLQASKYVDSEYQAKRMDLLTKIDSLLVGHFRNHIQATATVLVDEFSKEIGEGDTSHVAKAAVAARARAKKAFSEAATEACLETSCYSYRTEQTAFETALEDALLAKLKKAATKQLSRLLEVKVLFTPTKIAGDVWDQVDALMLASIVKVVDGICSEPELATNKAKIHETVEAVAFDTLDKRILEIVRPASVEKLLRTRFNYYFNHDAQGLPVVWKKGEDMESGYKQAFAKSLEVLPLLQAATKEDASLFEKPSRLQTEDGVEYARLVTSSQAQEIEAQFREEAESIYVSAVRGAAQSAAHIPAYFWLLLLVLGWNEFMAILRNPLLVVLTLVMGGSLYVVYSLNLAGPVLNVVEATSSRTLEEVKQRLREYLEVKAPA